MYKISLFISNIKTITSKNFLGNNIQSNKSL